VSCLYFQGENTVLAGTIYGGIYRSDDAGATWRYDALSGNIVHTILDPGDGSLLAGYMKGVARSTNGGHTWDFPDLGAAGFIQTIIVDGTGTVFAGGHQGIFRSSDHGEHWEQVYVNEGSAQVLCLMRSGTTLYAGSSRSGLLRSMDGGETWNPVDTVFDGGRIRAMCRVDRTLLVNQWYDGIYVSSDNGASWSERSGGLDRPRCNEFHVCSNGDILASMYDGTVYRSTDTGDSWTQMGELPRQIEALTMRYGPDGSLLCGHVGTGLARSSDDGVHWTASATGMANHRVDDLLIDSEGAIHMTPFYWPWLKSTDGGDSWMDVDNTTNSGKLIDMGEDGTLYSTREYAGLFVSTDRGVTWEDVSDGLDSRPRFRVLGVAANGHAFVVLRDDAAYHLMPGSDSWDEVTGTLEGTRIRCFLRIPGYFFAGTQDGGLFRSADNGSSWVKCENGLPPSGILALHAHESTLYAGSFGNVFYSTDKGDSWEDIGDETEAVVTSLATDDDGTLYISTTARGVLSMREGTAMWKDFNDGLPREGVDEIGIDAQGMIYARVSWNGVYRREIATVEVAENPALPATCLLHQNYPNPFNPATMIQFDLPHCTTISLVITDALGREIARPADHVDMQAGTHSAKFDARGIPTGVYLYRLETEGTVLVKKMVVTK
jgi:photosystem II stability/assembly factor-like uncharacterized protein